MLTGSRAQNALLTGATKDVLLRLFTQPQPGSLRSIVVRPSWTSHHINTTVSRRSYGNVTRPARTGRNIKFDRTPGGRPYSDSAPKNVPSPHEPGGLPPPKPESKFKQMSRKYGWAAVGVYFGLSLLDFPFCFLAVRWLGSDRIVAAEEWVVDGFWDVTEKAAPGARESCNEWSAHLKERYREWRGTSKLPVDGPMDDLEDQANEMHLEKSRHHEASLGTQLALAYALHKSLIFFRLPLAASITPGIAKWLRKRGWNVGNRTKKPSASPVTP
ncbi:DUF1279 superfamily [Elasticomyces elasticus]|nr:DUF1279 superfamily [Elasticomyces elasticus]KAK4976906.1 DUF1279 superfamily [Elasticomyces elasticus]